MHMIAYSTAYIPYIILAGFKHWSTLSASKAGRILGLSSEKQDQTCFASFAKEKIPRNAETLMQGFGKEWK